MAALHYSSSSGSTGHGVPPDQDTAGLQAQLQHMTVHDSAMHTLPVHAALEGQLCTSAAAGGFLTGSAAAVDASQGDDARFLDHLFSCPITKVSHQMPYSLHLPHLLPTLSHLIPHIPF